MSFVHLHNHTHFSLLDGLTKIDELIDNAKKEGSPAVAITDHGVMYGVIDFYQKCLKAGIKPIIGVEAYLAPRSRLKKETKEDKRNYHLLLLAKNNVGYYNLIKLVSISHLEGFYYKPRIDMEVLKKYSEGLIGGSACLGGEIPQLIIAQKYKKAEKKILEYNKIFGQDNFYLELQHHPNLKYQAEVNSKLIEFSKKLNVPLIATNDMHYLKKEDAEVQDILLCLQNKKKKTDTNRMNMLADDFSMKSNAEMIESFKHVPEAIENTLKIAEKCNVEIKLGDIQLPAFKVPEEYNEDSYLRKLCIDGLSNRYGKSYAEITKVQQERLDYELSVIKDMGWPAYFLIVADFVTWSRKQKIVVGPGRGSAAGSFVSYLLGITNLDPLEYDLLFERFLNPERVSMPDIDLDFADSRRGEVIKYVEDVYGKNNVCQIITFGTMAARAAVRDVGRVLDYPYALCDKISKMIPTFTTIGDALKNVDEVKQIYKNDSGARQILDYAQRIEGVVRHSSTHACGVLITKKTLDNYTPVQYASSSDRTPVSQYSVHPVEDLGLLKMDFLGLKNLTIIESTINLVKNIRKIVVDIDNLPTDDDKTLALFRAGETTGVFQFESSGMKRYLKELKPTEFEDIIAMVALYRPGPIEWIPDYIAGKHGKKKVTYLHEKLQPILEKTYGVAIYQEQVMQMARTLAGFSMGGADILRKAVGKKIPKLLIEQKKKFIEGCVKNSINKKLAEKIFSFIEPFAGYGFNRSHAACYAFIGYQTAYLKAHFPAEFMAALLTADQQNTDRVAIEIEECRNMGIDVLPPDINESFDEFSVIKLKNRKNNIRFGLNAIKNVGEHIVEAIIKERSKNGYFVDIFDFLERVISKDLNKKSMESLIKCGAFDNFGQREQLLDNCDTLLALNKEFSRMLENNQTSLFEGTEEIKTLNRVKLEPAKERSDQEKLLWEKELLGLYITEHPFREYKKYLHGLIKPLTDLNVHMDGKFVQVGGIISVIKKILTRRNKSMLFVKIEDGIATIELLVFPNVLEKTETMWQEGKAIICQGKISNKDQDIKIIVDDIFPLDLNHIKSSIEEFKKTNRKVNSGSLQADSLKIIFHKVVNKDMLSELKKIFIQNNGENRVFLKIAYNGENKYIKSSFKVNYNDELVNKIKNKFDGIISVV